MNTLKNLNFGEDSAESEMQYLKYIFFSLPFYENLKGTKKWLILGRKGSGKTAACYMFFDQIQHSNFVSMLTPKSLSAAKSAIVEKSSISPEEAAIQKWKYLFLLEASRYIIHMASEKFGTNYLSWAEPLKKVRAFLIKNDENSANGLDRSLKFVRSIKKLAVSVLKVEGSVELENFPTEATIDDLSYIQILIEQSYNLLDDKKIYFLVDQVDELWDTTVEGQKLIIGLLRATKEINDNFDFIKVVVFLRTDIFSYLRFHDSDKYRGQTEFISWDVESLKKLIGLRIRKFTNLRTDLNGLWANFFPPHVRGKNSFEFLVQYTLMRPRDLIQLCNKCRDVSIRRHGEQVTEDDIIKAINDYSIWKLEDLVSEYAIQYPFLEQVLGGVFYAGSNYEFSRENIQQLLNITKAELVRLYGIKYFEPIDVLLQILYTIGFLGVNYHGDVLFEFLGDKVVLPYANLFHVNKAFRKGLRLPDPDIDAHEKLPNISVELHGDGAIVQGDGNVISVRSGIGISGRLPGDATTDAPPPAKKKRK